MTELRLVELDHKTVKLVFRIQGCQMSKKSLLRLGKSMCK